jgi:hypothetical protein
MQGHQPGSKCAQPMSIIVFPWLHPMALPTAVPGARGEGSRGQEGEGKEAALSGDVGNGWRLARLG